MTQVERCTICHRVPALPRYVRATNGSRDLVCSARCADAHRTPSRTPRPTTDELYEMVSEGSALATDGCLVEPDGACPHGAESWLIALGLI